MKKRLLWLGLLLVPLLFLLRRETPAGPSEALLRAAQGLDEITVSARLDAENRTLWVTQTLRLQNRTGERQSAAVLRTWPNAHQEAGGGLLLDGVHVNGEVVTARFRDEAQTVLSVPVPGGWEQAVEIGLEYRVIVPMQEGRFGLSGGVFSLGDAFAVPAVWESGAFRTEPDPFVGPPSMSDCANWVVTVGLPRGYTCAGGAIPTPEGENRFRFEAPAARGFAFIAGEGLHTAEAMQDGIVIRACASDARTARQLAAYAQKALRCFSERYGGYPYSSYTVAEAGMAHGGASYSAFAMLAPADGRALEYAVVHEAARQWWSLVVGTDRWFQPWQDEALCAFSLLEYAETVYGPGERDDLEATRAEASLRVTVSVGVTPGAPLSAFASESEYALVVRDRGCACLLALDRTAPGGLDGFLRDYYARFAFGRASRPDFEALLAQSTGMDFAPLLRDYLDTQLLH